MSYDLNAIKFSTEAGVFKRAIGLYEGGKVTQVQNLGDVCSAVVLGTEPYDVSVSVKNYKRGYCTCYVGQQDIVCKHMIALALYVVMHGQALSTNEKEHSNSVVCSTRRGLLSKEEAAGVAKEITESLRYIKAYSGPSRTWFANQDSLSEGCNRLSAIVSDLPVGKPSAQVLVKLLLRLDKKLSVGGVDDSNGIVSGFMHDVVEVLEEFARIDSACMDVFKALVKAEPTCFGWEEPLVGLLKPSQRL